MATAGWPNTFFGFVRDPTTGALVTTGGGGGGGTVQVADGTTSTQLLKVLADGSINVNSTPGTEVATAASGAALPALIKAVGGSDGTNLRPLKTDGTGILQTALTNASIAVTGTFWQATQPVSGTFWQATQPVSGTVTSNQGGAPWTQRLQDGAGATLATVTAGNALKVDGSAVTQPVSGTFWQATQPVSGTFWQATQPVSGTVTANQGTAAAIASAWPHKLTDGTSTQAVKAASTAAVAADQAAVVSLSPNSPISFSADVTTNFTFSAAAQTIALTVPAGGRSVHYYFTGSPWNAGTILQFEATYDNTNWFPLGMIYRGGIAPTVATSVNGSNFGVTQYEANCAGLLAVRVRCSAYTASDAPVATLRISQADIGNQGGLPQVVASAAADGNAVLGNPVRIAGSDAGTTRDINTNPKGTQATRGVGVQNLRDAGRVGITISGYQVAGTITTETAMSLVKQADGVAVAAATSYTVTTGKRLRLQQLVAGYKQNAAAVSTQKIALRYASTAPTNASPVIAYLDLESTSATTGTMVGPVAFDFPDGFEIPATFVLSVFNLASAATNLVTVTLVGYEY